MWDQTLIIRGNRIVRRFANTYFKCYFFFGHIPSSTENETEKKATAHILIFYCRSVVVIILSYFFFRFCGSLLAINIFLDMQTCLKAPTHFCCCCCRCWFHSIYGYCSKFSIFILNANNLEKEKEKEKKIMKKIYIYRFW